MSVQHSALRTVLGPLALPAAALLVACVAARAASSPDAPLTPTPAARQSASVETKAPAVASAAPSRSPANGPTVTAESTPDASAALSSVRVMPDVAYWATPQPVVDKMLELARVKADDVVYDLGCGDARSVVTAAVRYGARGVGFDIDPRRVAEARDNASRHGVSHLVTIEQADIFTIDLSPADVIFLYLVPRLNWRLVPQLERLRLDRVSLPISTRYPGLGR